MQDRQLPAQRNNQQSITTRSERLLQHLEDLWQNYQNPSFETLRRIISTLPEPYRTMGIEAIAERLVNDSKLHFLDIIATFYERAEQEGISTEERDETLQDASVDAFRFMQLSKQLSVNTLDGLLTLGNTTLGLLQLSRVNNAEDAQTWIYRLPVLYNNKMEQEHLTFKNIRYTVSFSFEHSFRSTIQTIIQSGRQTKAIKAPSLSFENNWSKLLSSSAEANSHINPIATNLGSSNR